MTENSIVIPEKKYLKIGETSNLLGVKAHVLRYWESEFPQIKPIKSRTGQRMYRRQDVLALIHVQELLYEQKFTIKGAREALKAFKANKSSSLGRKKKPPVQTAETEAINYSELRKNITLSAVSDIVASADLRSSLNYLPHISDDKIETRSAPESKPEQPRTEQPKIDWQKPLHEAKETFQTILSRLDQPPFVAIRK